MTLNGRKTIGRYIALLYRMATLYLGQELPAVNISTGQYILLAELFDEDGLSQEELTQRVYVDKANTARAIKKLEEKGYVRRLPDENDGRIKRVYLQPSARVIEEKFWLIITGWSDIINKDIPKGKQEILINTLNKMADNASMFLKRYGNDKTI